MAIENVQLMRECSPNTCTWELQDTRKQRKAAGEEERIRQKTSKQIQMSELFILSLLRLQSSHFSFLKGSSRGQVLGGQ